MSKTTLFQERVYAALEKVPEGKVTTYGDLAKVLKTSPRAVGQALKRNPYAPQVPCHRVVAANGSVGGFRGKKAGKAIQEKITLLRKEGIEVKNGFVEAFEKKKLTLSSSSS